LLWNGPMQV
nr:Chain C, LEU-LEU-TRP-ASN-GLY-PRO-MET-GLN-VAL [Yellow fever virus]6SSA_F Chain F, LEU-LEU-TRP-ASN-GLY-PRO-MET-GLN-VAL [Yellow fever virus]6SSA_I Chain I, LEU-LEU-TRP-ASN-GLY-PRO-MET-GLN-VAL [Yellow fever virus]6SSA_L Chain L, LEU-LEU-TRP-ASN-GLY-PRO-MET-GLN-VAL [Yellow fever virus]